MKNYELTYLISAELLEEEVKAFQEKINSLVKEEGGVLVGVNPFSRKRLPQPIKNQTQVYLAVLNFQINPGSISSLEKKLKSENQILRYLLLTKPRTKEILVRGKKEPSKPKVVVTEKEKKVELKEIEKKLEEILNEPK